MGEILNGNDENKPMNNIKTDSETQSVNKVFFFHICIERTTDDMIRNSLGCWLSWNLYDFKESICPKRSICTNDSMIPLNFPCFYVIGFKRWNIIELKNPLRSLKEYNEKTS